MASESRWRKRERHREIEAEKAEKETDKVEVAPGVIVGSLRGFRAALIGPTRGLPKRRRLRRQGSLKTIPERERERERERKP